MKCNDCKYWTNYKGRKEDGQCRRFNPELVTDISGGGIATAIGISTKVKTMWPETSYDDWCGEFAPESKPAPVEEKAQ